MPALYSQESLTPDTEDGATSKCKNYTVRASVHVHWRGLLWPISGESGSKLGETMDCPFYLHDRKGDSSRNR